MRPEEQINNAIDKFAGEIGWMIFGLIYLWIRDSELPLTEETGTYLQSHFKALRCTDGLQFSNQEIVDFIYEYLGEGDSDG